MRKLKNETLPTRNFIGSEHKLTELDRIFLFNFFNTKPREMVPSKFNKAVRGDAMCGKPREVVTELTPVNQVNRLYATLFDSRFTQIYKSDSKIVI